MLKLVTILFCCVSFCAKAQLGTMGPNDTIPVLVYKNGVDSFAYYYQEGATVYGKASRAVLDAAYRRKMAMHRYVDSTYPMAIQAADLVNEIRREKLELDKRRDKRKLVKRKERELKAQFTDKIKHMYIGQGKVLIKLLYRETGSTAYDIIREMKSGINARFWQTMSFFFEGNLKATYDPNGLDWEMEQYVRQVARQYGRT